VASVGGGEGIEQAGVQAVLEEDVGGESGLHGVFLKVQQAGLEAVERVKAGPHVSRDGAASDMGHPGNFAGA
jgi:hypothetical protein